MNPDYYGNVTFVLSLPRSRTYWLSQVLAVDPNTVVMHDPLKQCESIGELQGKIDEALALDTDAPGLNAKPNTVVVIDTAAVFFYPEINIRFPRARYLFLRRGAPDVMRSLASAGQPTEMVKLANRHYTAARALVAADKHFCNVVQYEDLDDVRVLHNIWRNVGILDAPPEGHFERMVNTNLQIPFPEQQKATDQAKVAKLFAHRREWL
jgi:hypothetical protein